MRRYLSTLLLGMVLCHVGLTAAKAADSGSKELGDVLQQFTSATHYIWTDDVWYNTGDQHTLRWTADAQGDPYPYVVMVKLVDVIEGDVLGYVNAANGTLSDTPIDAFGGSEGNYNAAPLSTVSGMDLISAPVPGPGYYHFVAELRSPDGSQVIKTAWAKYAVVDSVNDLGSEDVEIGSDTTWSGVVRLQSQVFVNDGATLTIEPGTFVVASGQNAVIVVEQGGRIVAEGYRERPIVMTCDAPVGQRFSGCWAGLIILGRAPINVEGGTAVAEGVIPADRPVYGGDDPEDDSGSLKYVRVEFAGVDFTPEIQPNAFGFHGLGSGTKIEYIQAHDGEDDGIEFFGGNANMKHWISDGSKDDSLDWTFGWTGLTQFGYVRQNEVNADNGIEADGNSNGPNNEPRSNPSIYNATFIGSSIGDVALQFRVGSSVQICNVIATGFVSNGITFTDDDTRPLTMNGTANVESLLLWNNDSGGQTLADQVPAEDLSYIMGQSNVVSVDPALRNTRLVGNPDPRPLEGSVVATPGVACTPPSNGFFDTSATYFGAFGSENWMEEWTFFPQEVDLQ